MKSGFGDAFRLDERVRSGGIVATRWWGRLLPGRFSGGSGYCRRVTQTPGSGQLHGRLRPLLRILSSAASRQPLVTSGASFLIFPPPWQKTPRTGGEIREAFLRFFEERGTQASEELLARSPERSHAALT